MKKITIAIYLILMFAVACYADAQFNYQMIIRWSNTQNTRTFNSKPFVTSTNPWSIGYSVKQIDKTIPGNCAFVIYGFPLDKEAEKTPPIIIVSSGGEDLTYVYGKGKYYFQIISANCTWDAAVYNCYPK